MCVRLWMDNPMDHVLLFMQDHLERFERWFDERFGWFFTNGMKGRQGR